MAKKKCKYCRKYEEKITILEDELSLMRLELADIKGKLFKKKRKKSKDDEDAKGKPVPKKKGGVFGHKGWFRKKPKHIHKTEIVKLDKCPCCGGAERI